MHTYITQAALDITACRVPFRIFEKHRKPAPTIAQYLFEDLEERLIGSKGVLSLGPLGLRKIPGVDLSHSVGKGESSSLYRTREMS
ncbi:hypothetical protein AWB68_06799 [Caballeronia choica]|jgi:hypothetical protein|uniref:Uncharacterized protein n=1 Tax=Caballeronia choica TaxID=326476 RepID=A0A158KRV0_9BURK|nr:hypothetical protein AWB68_06799 [Caballeronia choica]